MQLRIKMSENYFYKKRDSYQVMEMYGKTFDKILLLLENLKKTGAWFVLAVHGMGHQEITVPG